MKEYTTFEIIILWKRARNDPFILRYLSELTGVSVDDIIFMLECYGYKPDVKQALKAEPTKDRPKPTKITNRKFTDDYYNQMVERVKSGQKIKDVCKEFHVSTSGFWRWRNKQIGR